MNSYFMEETMCAKENNENKKDFISSCCCNGMAEMMVSRPNGEINSGCFSWMNKTDEKFCCPGCSDSEKDGNSNCCLWPFSSSPAK